MSADVPATFTMGQVGVVHNGRLDPGDSDHWGDVVSVITLDERFGEDCLVGLADYSHVEVFYVFDRAEERPDYRGLRHPRGRSDLPAVGVFADRGPRRPNRIGATVCPVVHTAGRELHVRGLDAVTGTPVLDLKPVMRAFLPAEIREPERVGLLMRDYFLS